MAPVFLLIATVSVLWLWREGVTEAPWLQEGHNPSYRTSPRRPATVKAGLIIFLAVALCLFSLISAAFFMRMESADWLLPSPPRILWLNTLALIISSTALQIAHSAAKSLDLLRTRKALAICALASLIFFFGQLWAWREMTYNGFLASQNPANAFFFLLTGIHGLHLLGGIVALGRVGKKLREDNKKTLPETLFLCTIYWHFILCVWFFLLILLTGWASNLGVICRLLS